MLMKERTPLCHFDAGKENDDEPQQAPPPKLSAAGRKKFDDEDVEDEVKVRL